jgi:hypothetical protein
MAINHFVGNEGSMVFGSTWTKGDLEISDITIDFNADTNQNAFMRGDGWATSDPTGIAAVGTCSFAVDASAGLELLALLAVPMTITCAAAEASGTDLFTFSAKGVVYNIKANFDIKGTATGSYSWAWTEKVVQS